MGAARESASLWVWLTGWFKPWTKAKWQWQALRRLLRSPEFVQDNFLTPWNRLLGCRLRGGHEVTVIDIGNNERRPFCFRCYRYQPQIFKSIGRPRE